MKAIVAVGALAIALLPAVSNVSAARPAGFNYWAHEAYSLRDSKTFIIHGDRLSKGCSINHPPIENSDDGQPREQRDIAVDTVGCRVLVEEGLSPVGVTSPVLAGGTVSEILSSSASKDRDLASRIQPEAMSVDAVQPRSAINPDLPTYRHQKLWHEDIVGIVVNSLDTKIKYYWDGHCALGGTVIGAVTYNAGTGWTKVGGSASESETCARYQGNAFAWFRNSTFCSQDGGQFIVDIDYNVDRVTGSYTGAITYAKDVSVSPSCAPLFFHQATGSWTP